MTVCKKVLVKGFVQGVSFRKQTRRIAEDLGIKGWVRNLSNGNVEAILAGEERAVNALVAWCAFGPKRGQVEEVVIADSNIDPHYPDFRIEADRVVVPDKAA
jgi:acylphosphatase